MVGDSDAKSSALTAATLLTRRRFGLVAGAGLALAAGGVRAQTASDEGGEEGGAEEADPLAPLRARGWLTGDIVFGSPDAKVEVIEYASMTCGHCASFHANTWPALKERYVDTGKVRFVFREFPFDQWGLRASMLARCSGEMRFQNLVTLLFEKQRQWARGNTPEDAIANLAPFAKLAGMGQAEFDACMTSEPLANVVIRSRLEGEQKYRVESTPSFIINGELVAGDMPIEAFEKHLAPHLSES